MVSVFFWKAPADKLGEFRPGSDLVFDLWLIDYEMDWARSNRLDIITWNCTKQMGASWKTRLFFAYLLILILCENTKSFFESVADRLKLFSIWFEWCFDASIKCSPVKLRAVSNWDSQSQAEILSLMKVNVQFKQIQTFRLFEGDERAFNSL